MILDDFILKGKTAIVTGCSTGLGQGMALGLAEAGAKVLGIDYVDSGETIELMKKMGAEFKAMKEDLSTLEPVERIIDAAVEAFGGVDILSLIHI